MTLIELLYNPIDLFGTGLTKANTLLCILAYLASLVLAISIHEFAHAFAAVKCGDTTPKEQGRLTLNPASHLTGLGLVALVLIGFGWGKPVHVNPSNFKNYKKGQTLTAIAGVLTNFVLSFIFVGIYLLFCYLGDHYSNSNRAVELLLYFLTLFSLFFYQINIALCVFNLLPIYPLDGFRFIASKAKPDNKFVKFMYDNGTKVFFCLIILGIVAKLVGMPYLDILGIAINFVESTFLMLFSLFWSLFI